MKSQKRRKSRRKGFKRRRRKKKKKQKKRNLKNKILVSPMNLAPSFVFVEMNHSLQEKSSIQLRPVSLFERVPCLAHRAVAVLWLEGTLSIGYTETYYEMIG